MSSHPQIVLHHINFSLINKPIISNLSCSFNLQKYGVTGRNGIGKSTLLKIIAGENQPSGGSLRIEGKIAYFSQEIFAQPNNKVSDILGITDKLQALERIAKGSVNEQDFNLVGDDWCLQGATQRNLMTFDLQHIALDRLGSSLSGGEYTRLLLVKTFMSTADFLILDEPTNNLDAPAREAFYRAIAEWRGGLIIVSHDRELLNLMDHIVELSPLGVHFYGGNYSDYLEQKKTEQAAAQQQLQAVTQLQRQAREVTQIRRERHEQARAKGCLARKTEIAKVGILKSRIAFDSAKGRSDRTQRRVILQTERKLEKAAENIAQAKEKVLQNPIMDISLPNTNVPTGKMIVEIKNLDFKYLDQAQFLIKNFSLTLQGPERVAIIGKNGCGKTTLLRLILGEIKPCGGFISLGTERIRYLDQKLSILDDQLTLLDNFLRINPNIKERDARYSLADFLFRNDEVLKKVVYFSSGERLRATLACILMSATPPQLLILDEPTNHLDLYTINVVESILKKYQGAVLVISHDQVFLENIQVERTVKMHYSS